MRCKASRARCGEPHKRGTTRQRAHQDCPVGTLIHLRLLTCEADVLIDFFFTLKDARIPVSIKEFMILLEAMQKNVISPSLDDFYYLSRTTLVKDEAHYDKFDKAFGLYFRGIDTIFEKNPEIPLEWLQKRMERELTPEQKAAIEKFGY